MPCCRQSSMAIVHTMFIFANSKSKKYATTQLFKSLETHLLWIFPYSLEVEINNGFWSENSKNHLRERFPKDRCSNLQSFLLFIQSTLDLPNGIFAWWNGKCINDFTLTSTKKKKKDDLCSQANSTHFTLWYRCLSLGKWYMSTLHYSLHISWSIRKNIWKLHPFSAASVRSGGKQQNEWFSFSYRGERLWRELGASDVLAALFWLCQRALLIVTRSWKKVPPLAAFMGTNKAFHSVPASVAGLTILGWGKVAHHLRIAK